eukprot:275961-Amphidinium_carterae.1
MAKSKARAAATQRRVQNHLVRHRMRGKQQYDRVDVTYDRFGLPTYHPPGELPPRKKVRTYVVPPVEPVSDSGPVRVPRAAPLGAGSSGALASSASKMSPATDPIQPATTERNAEVLARCDLLFRCKSIVCAFE